MLVFWVLDLRNVMHGFFLLDLNDCWGNSVSELSALWSSSDIGGHWSALWITSEITKPKNYVEMLWNLTYYEPESLLRGNVAGEWYAWRCECFLVPSAVWYCLRFWALRVGSRWSLYDFCECLICERTYIMPCLLFTEIEWLLRSLVYELAAIWACSDMGGHHSQLYIRRKTTKARKCCEFDLFWAGRVAQA